MSPSVASSRRMTTRMMTDLGLGSFVRLISANIGEGLAPSLPGAREGRPYKFTVGEGFIPSHGRAQGPPLLLLLIAALISVPVLAQDSSTHTHDPIKIGKKKVEVGVGKQAEQLDSVADYCLQCHGEDEAGEAPVPEHSIGAANRSHPVDVTYPVGDGSYKSVEGLDKRLVLIQGQMTCVTCHDPVAPDHHLVIPNAGSQICIACHNR